MTDPKRYEHIARVVVETGSPLSIATGRASERSDVELVQDANGLPALPGTSLAGVLRSLYAAGHGPEDVNGLFGKGGSGSEEGQSSRLRVSWGVLHDAGDTPVEGLVDPADLDDPVLRSAMSPLLRDHVRLNHRGVTDERGKFDRTGLCPGHRFTFELSLCDGQPTSPKLEEVLALVASPRFRMGGATRAGYGELKLVRCHARDFDLKDRDDREAWLGLSGRLGDVTAFRGRSVEPPESFDLLSVDLALRPTEPWYVGGGEGDASTDPGPRDDKRKEADLNPLLEERVVWSPQGTGQVVPHHSYLLPASSVKGALRHRTAFHYRAEKGLWADSADVLARKEEGQGAGLDPWAPDSHAGLRTLFGAALDHGGEDGVQGQAGLVWISDGRVLREDASRRRAMHVSLDRFTGGARAGFLFSEDVLDGQAPVALTVQVARPKGEDNPELEAALQAFARAIEDLCEGRLQLGGGSGRGRGWFQADVPDLSGLKGTK